MKKEVKIIEENIDYHSLLFGYGDAELSEKIRNAIRHLLQAYKEDEAIIDKLASFIFHEHYKMTYVDEKQFEERKSEIIREILEGSKR